MATSTTPHTYTTDGSENSTTCGNANFRAANEQLGHTPYLVGSEITVADLGLYPVYVGRKALIDGAGLKNMTAWGSASARDRACRRV